MDRSEVPFINWLRPENEQPFAYHICQQLRRLVSAIEHFRRAVELVDHCKALIDENRAKHGGHGGWQTGSQFVDWMTIAGRDAALTIYHFQSTVRSIRDQLHRAPTLKRKVDTKALEEAYNRIHREFPGWKSLRDAVGHRADMSFKPEDIEFHQVEEGVFVQSAFNTPTREFITTRNKRFQVIAVTEESVDKMTAITRDVFAAFRKAALRPRPD